MGGGLQVLLGLWLMLEVCSLSVVGFCMNYCVLILIYGSVTMTKEKSRIRQPQRSAEYQENG